MPKIITFKNKRQIDNIIERVIFLNLTIFIFLYYHNLHLMLKLLLFNVTCIQLEQEDTCKRNNRFKHDYS